MNLGQAGRLRDLPLGEQEIARAGIRRRLAALADIQLAQQVRDALLRVALPDADHPFALDRAGDKLAPAEYLRKAGAAVQQVARLSAPDLRHTQAADRGERMIAAADGEQVEVAKLAGQIERQYLAPAIGKLLVFLRPSVEHDMQRPRPFALADQIGALAMVAGVARQAGLPRDAFARRQQTVENFAERHGMVPRNRSG